MPEFNSKAGNHGISSVTNGKVYWTNENKVTCHRHGAMNKMSPDGIWRCIMCNEGAYLPQFDIRGTMKWIKKNGGHTKALGMIFIWDDDLKGLGIVVWKHSIFIGIDNTAN